jgi:hypothetical protein
MVVQIAVFLVIMAYFSNRLPVASNVQKAQKSSESVKLESTAKPKVIVENVAASSATLTSVDKEKPVSEKFHRRRSDNLYLHHNRPVQFLSPADTSLVRSGK